MGVWWDGLPEYLTGGYPSYFLIAYSDEDIMSKIKKSRIIFMVLGILILAIISLSVYWFSVNWTNDFKW